MKNIIYLLIILTLNIYHSWGQAIQSYGVTEDPGIRELSVRTDLPEPTWMKTPVGKVHLMPGLFQERRELTKAYIKSLNTRNIFQNHMLEACIRIDDPSKNLHQGWEAPHYQLRGHFAGHWLSSGAQFAAHDDDKELEERISTAIDLLEKCQNLNGGEWVGSVPEKYFDILENGSPIWSPQYTLHKTLMGLYDSYHYLENPKALEVLENAASWYEKWTESLIKKNRGDVIYSGECAGMLELWTDLFALTQNPKYLNLAARYSQPDLFKGLLQEQDMLSNDHTNATIPWIHGAARLYEITGDAQFREIVEAFWTQAVEDRGMFATTGNNAGEFWIPPHHHARFLGSRTQEHCTVYNMIRVADYLLRWTGDAAYANYIERALYNGILAQQNPKTGLVAYFLPTQPGAQKVWGSETDDFWCCHGTLVQAQATYEDLIYYQSENSITVSQFIPSNGSFQLDNQQIEITQQLDTSGNRTNFETQNPETTQWVVKLSIQSNKDTAEAWTLRIRNPWWVIGSPNVTLDGKTFEQITPNASGFLSIPIKNPTATVEIAFNKQVVRETLPGDNTRFVLVDGPVVLAALCEEEPVIVGSNADNLTPQYEHQYISGRDWQSEHYLLKTKNSTIQLKPLYEIADELYAIYMRCE